MKNKIDIIREDNSRIASYVILKKIGEENFDNFLEMEDIKYIDFLEESKKFFDKEMLGLDLFEIGIFFRYIEKLVDYHRGITIIDNLELVQNILYNLEEYQGALQRFFDSMIMKAYTGKVVFIITEVKKMKLESILKKSKLPKNNIIMLEDERC